MHKYMYVHFLCLKVWVVFASITVLHMYFNTQFPGKTIYNRFACRRADAFFCLPPPLLSLCQCILQKYIPLLVFLYDHFRPVLSSVSPPLFYSVLSGNISIAKKHGLSLEILFMRGREWGSEVGKHVKMGDDPVKPLESRGTTLEMATSEKETGSGGPFTARSPSQSGDDGNANYRPAASMPWPIDSFFCHGVWDSFPPSE